MAGSSNLHPAPVLQLNLAGPRISSVKKSLMSIAKVYQSRDVVVNEGPTNTAILSTNESVRDTLTLDVFTCINGRIDAVAWFSL
jgi:hypothetical protein